MAEIDLFFGINNSDDEERIHQSSNDKRKQWSSVVPTAPQETTNIFSMDGAFDKPMSQVLKSSREGQNKQNRMAPKRFKVPYVNDPSFDDLSVDSLQNFSLSQALLPTQERLTDKIDNHRNAMKRKSRSNDNENYIHFQSKKSSNTGRPFNVSPSKTVGEFNGSQTTYSGITEITDAMTPSHREYKSNKKNYEITDARTPYHSEYKPNKKNYKITNAMSPSLSEYNPNKKNYENVQRRLFSGSGNKENDIYLKENYSQAFVAGDEKKSQNSVVYDCVSKRVSDSLSTPAPLCFTGQKNVQHNLRSVDEIPVKFREVFEFPYFNMVQSMVFDEVFYTDKPIVVAAPTGAGKTVIFELAIIRLLTRLQDSRSNVKIIYMAPMKALCTEKFLEWKSKFSPHNLNLMELTGDTELESFSELQEEKWDSMSRKWKDNRSLFQTIGLFLIDEIHILNDCNRGATVEAVVSRMKTLQLAERSADRTNMRFIAVSATMPNIEDIAKWLGSSGRPAVHFKLDEQYRPVHLQKVVMGYPFKEGFSEFRFDMNLGYKIKGIIDAYSNNKPTLVFCSSRKSVQYTGETLKKENYGRSLLKSQHRDHVQKTSRSLNDSKVSELVYIGIGTHHAGMEVHDRNLVEKLFREGELPVLIATSTLAMGVNLPAHLVVIKSTMFYNMGVATEYSDTQVLQMIGRAGRPQFDKSATAVIMTKSTTKSKYESLLNGTQLIESSLHKNLIEHLNAEVVLHTITDMALAVEWIRHTFLYVRVMKNPKHYGYPTGLDWKQMEKKLEDLCLRNLNLLAGLSLVNLHEETFEIVPTDTGKLMARYCIAFETMKNFHQVKTDASMKDMIDVMVGCREFEDITLRNNEKSLLNSLNKDKHKENIRFQMTGKIKTKQMKVNCLIQAQLGCLSIQDFSLSQDVNKIFRIGQRVTKCLKEFLWQRKDYTSLLTAIQLFKCVKTKLWDDSKYVTKQLDGIGPTMSLALMNAGLTTFHALEDTNPREIELIVNRHPPFGNQIRTAVATLPKYEMSIEQLKNYKPQSSVIVIHINLVNKEIILEHTGGKIDHQSVLLIGDQDNSVVFKWRIIDASIVRDDGWSRRIEVKRAQGGPDLHVHLLSVEYVGLDIHTNYTPVYTGSFFRESNIKAVTDRRGTSKAINKTLTEAQHGRSCNHKCHNKAVCAHKCCKQGLSSSVKNSVCVQNKEESYTDTCRGKRGFEAQISLLKNKMLQLTDASPVLKRQKMKDERFAQSTIDLNQFVYQKASPLKSRRVDMQVEPASSDEHLNRHHFTDNGGWTQLDMYQQEREFLYQEDEFDIGIPCSTSMPCPDMEDKKPDCDFEEKQKAFQNTHPLSASPFSSDEELCLAEEMAQYTQQNDNLNMTHTNQLQENTYDQQSRTYAEKQLRFNNNSCGRMSGTQDKLFSSRSRNQKQATQQIYNQNTSHLEPEQFRNKTISNQPHYSQCAQITENVPPVSKHYTPQVQMTENASDMTYERHYTPKLQMTENAPDTTYERHYTPRNIPKNTYESHLNNRQTSVLERPHLVSQNISMFDMHKNQYGSDFENSEHGKHKIDESKKVLSYKKFPNYNDCNMFGFDQTSSDKGYDCMTVFDESNISKEMMHISMDYLHEPHTSNTGVKFQHDTSPRHTYGQVLGWVTDGSSPIDHSQPLSKHRTTPLLKPERSPFQRHSKSPYQETCESIKKDGENCEDTTNRTLASNKTGCFFHPYRSDSVCEVPDVGSSLFAGIF